MSNGKKLNKYTQEQLDELTATAGHIQAQLNDLDPTDPSFIFWEKFIAHLLELVAKGGI